MKPYVLNAEHRQFAEGNFPYGSVKNGVPKKRGVPGWLLDRLADEKLMGGYSKKKNPTCPVCYTMISNNGTCFC